MSKKQPVIPTVFPHPVTVGSVVVKIYKCQNKGRESFYISHFANGKRFQKMCVDFADAEREARAVANFHNRGEIAVLELTSGDRISYLHAIEALKPTGMALELAAKEYAEAWKVMNGRGSLLEAAKEYARRNLADMPSILVPAAVDEFLYAKENENLSDVYLKALKGDLGKFKATFGCVLREINTSQICDFLRSMKGSQRTKNNARQTLGIFFNYAKSRGYLPKDHDGIDFVPKFKEAPSAIEIFTPEEIGLYLKQARPELVPFLAIGAFAGVRSAELQRLDWREVHLKDRFIEVAADKAKTASRRVVPIVDNLAAWLAAYKQDAGSVVPFANMSKQIGWLVDAVNLALSKEAKEAGKDPEKAKISWKANALRHSFISYRVADIQNVNQVALEAGNSAAMIFKHYRELVRPAEAKKWFGVMPNRETAPADLPEVKAA
jgi:integrase